MVLFIWKKKFFCPIKNTLILCFHRIVKTSLKQITRKEIAHRRVNIKHCAPEQKLKKKTTTKRAPTHTGEMDTMYEILLTINVFLFKFSNI